MESQEYRPSLEEIELVQEMLTDTQREASEKRFLEIKRAEGMMTDEQRAASEAREKEWRPVDKAAVREELRRVLCDIPPHFLRNLADTPEVRRNRRRSEEGKKWVVVKEYTGIDALYKMLWPQGHPRDRYGLDEGKLSDTPPVASGLDPRHHARFCGFGDTGDRPESEVEK